jgi:multidrug/hemolysin transport system ATP-binding protein
MKSVIEIKNLKKSFKNIKAVDDISFKVDEGSLFAFLGLNGAGKSTTINIICGVYTQDEGEVIIDGCTNSELVKDKLGVVYQTSVLDDKLSVKDNLENRAALYNIYGSAFKERLENVSKLLQLDEFLNRPLNKLSGGQKRRVDIARALIHDPKILILDEPTTGLDPQNRKLVWNAINHLRDKNKITVFLTTHYLQEASDADHVVILDSGHIVASGTPIELKNKYTGDFITFYDLTKEEIESLNLEYEKLSNGYRIEVKDTMSATKLVLKHPNLFRDYEITKGDMDDVFLALTGKSLKKGDE